VNDKREDQGDGLEPRGNMDRRVCALTRSGTRKRCWKRRWQCSQLPAWTRRCGRSPSGRASASHRVSPLSAPRRPCRGRLPSRNRCLRRRRTDPGGGAWARRGAGAMDAALCGLYRNQTRACHRPALGESGLRQLTRLLRNATRASVSNLVGRSSRSGRDTHGCRAGRPAESGRESLHAGPRRGSRTCAAHSRPAD